MKGEENRGQVEIMPGDTVMVFSDGFLKAGELRDYYPRKIKDYLGKLVRDKTVFSVSKERIQKRILEDLQEKCAEENHPDDIVIGIMVV